MKKLQKLRLPENYQLSEDDINQTIQFDAFLNHLTDVSNSEPIYPIGIKSIGVTNQKATVTIESIESPHTYIPLLCEISTGVNLKGKRGIHTSRCIESIFTLSQRKFKTLDDFSYELACEVRKRQEADSAFAQVSGTYLQKQQTKKTNLETHDPIQLISKASVTEKKSFIITGMKVSSVTACPCTKTYTKYSTVPELKNMGLDTDQINRILGIFASGTHMQRGDTTLMVDKGNSTITYKDIYTVLDQSVHLVNELLKRPDEHDLVIRALKKPQFVEDLVREVMFNAYQSFCGKLSSEATLSVESILFDSIHSHDVHALITSTLGEIRADLEQGNNEA